MNRQEKLVETTIKMLLEDKKDYEKEVRDKYYWIERWVEDTFKEDMNMHAQLYPNAPYPTIKFYIEQHYLIDHKDCLNYIKAHTKKFPIKNYINFFKDTDEELNKAIDYVENEYLPALEDYMESHNKECQDLLIKIIKNMFTNKRIKTGVGIEDKIDIKVESPTFNLRLNEGTLHLTTQDIVTALLNIEKDSNWIKSYYLYPYEYKYIVTLDVGDIIKAEIKAKNYYIQNRKSIEKELINLLSKIPRNFNGMYDFKSLDADLSLTYDYQDGGIEAELTYLTKEDITTDDKLKIKEYIEHNVRNLISKYNDIDISTIDLLCIGPSDENSNWYKLRQKINLR